MRNFVAVIALSFALLGVACSNEQNPVAPSAQPETNRAPEGPQNGIYWSEQTQGIYWSE